MQKFQISLDDVPGRSPNRCEIFYENYSNTAAPLAQIHHIDEIEGTSFGYSPTYGKVMRADPVTPCLFTCVCHKVSPVRCCDPLGTARCTDIARRFIT